MRKGECIMHQNNAVLRHAIDFVLIGFALLFAAAESQAKAAFSPPVNVSNASGGGPQLALDQQGNIDLIWLQPPSGNSVPDVFFSRSTDKGKSFSTPLDISPDLPATTRRESPQIFVDALGIINVLWVN